MEQKKINIAELLKDCPKGMELDCAIFDTKVIYQGLSERMPTHPIVVQTEHGFEFELTQYGQIHNIVGSKCIIFPKGKTTWEGFNKFKDGDVVVTTLDNLAIIKERSINGEYRTHCLLLNDITTRIRVCPKRLATEEEKQKLFQAIKDNGYIWNAETKTLEKLVEPKFKIGDRIVKQNSISNLWIVSSISSQYYGLNLLKGGESIDVLPISEQDDWELIMGIRELAPNIEPKFKVGDKVVKKGGIGVPVLITSVGAEYYYSNTGNSVGFFKIKEQDDWELVPTNSTSLL